MKVIIYVMQNISAILHQLGQSDWRVGQEELVAAACSGKSVLGILPTGHGKSLCYQVAALWLGRCSLVISPLIALMREQVETLGRLGVAAARFDSSLDEEGRQQVLDTLAAGKLRLLYLAPESLENSALCAVIESLSARDMLGFFVVDEAHCVSEWGHSFRPDYLKLSVYYQRYSFYSLIAFTATAPPAVRDDLCVSFAIKEGDVFALPPYKANISRWVECCPDKDGRVVGYLHEPQRVPAIIYCRTRKGCEELVARLQEKLPHLALAAYHAGQPSEQREGIQDRFLSNEVQVMVATIAFGMGVDKPDIRSVIHYHAPASPESYVQESGRAGRDGLAASSLVLLDEADDIDICNRFYASQPELSALLRCARWLLPEHSRIVSHWELSTECDLSEDVLERCLSLLDGVVEKGVQAYKYYKVKPLFSMDCILDGREAEEAKRLEYLYQQREGEIEYLSDEWGLDYATSLQLLQECEDSQEWSVSYRQRSTLIHRRGQADAREIAAELAHYYDRQLSQSLHRWDIMKQIFLGEGCINRALHRYFTGEESLKDCAHCSACMGFPREGLPSTRPAPEATWLPAQLPDRLSETQRKRFLLGLISPALMRRRLWAHALYGCMDGARWQDV